MDFEALEAFLAVYENGSFSRAADHIFLTQPAISKRIANLEAQLGLRLFDRIGRGIYLTPGGEAFLAQARHILNAVAEAKRSISNLAKTVSGPLNLGTSHHIGLHRLPAALKRFNETYPEVRLDLHFMDSEKACHAVEQGTLELAVVTLPKPPLSNLELIPIWHDKLAVVVSKNHALGKKRHLTIAALSEYPAILPGAGTYTRDIILGALASVNKKLYVGMSSNYLEVLKMLVSIGLGWSALPHTLIDAELKVVHIEGVEIKRELGIVKHRGRTLSNAGSAMVKMIKYLA